MEKLKAAKLVINVENTSERRSKRKFEVSPKKTPPNKQPAFRTAKKWRSKKIEICDLVLTEAEIAMPYMDGVQHNKPIQPEFSRDSHRKESRKRKSVDPVYNSEESVPLEIPRPDEGPSGPQHSPNEEKHHGMQGSVVHHDLNVQISGLKSQNKVLTMKMDAIKSQMSSLNSD
ncbi:Hypothetical predicted protein [Olea europaea subsp. europaea]|uniref:Uncharacterized protein n=1 Tax=Olea europaea subsp. europaea TaxID=158383 RepID=A0A8S0SNA2_OLEEU|nr:Hypothetical predicted protein [Olea europaea subsp. europaea]